MGREAGAGGDQVTHDDVFLEAAQLVDLAERGRLGEDARGVLEDAAEMKLSVSSEALVMPSSTGRGLGGLAALVFDADGFPPRTRGGRSGRPRGSVVSPGSVIFTLRSIWRTMISMCLSLISTPWRR